MNMKNPLPAAFMLVFLVFAACSGKKTHTDENPDALIARQRTTTLIDTGANLNAKDYYGITALMQAAYYDAADVAKVLLTAGADADAKTHSGRTALMQAALFNSADVAKVLLAAGSDINAKDKDGKTAFMLAEEWSSADLAELLKAAGAR